MAMSRFAENIDPALLAILDRGFIMILEGIDDDTAEYVKAALVLLRANNSPRLQVIIDSPGGDMHSSLAIHDMLRSYEGGTAGIVIGKAASGANLILQGCDDRIATDNSFLFVHNMIVTAEFDVLNDRKKFQEYMEEMIGWQNKIYHIYQGRTGKSRRELRAIFKKQKVLSPEKGLSFKFIDEIIDPNDLRITAETEEGEAGQEQVIETSISDLAELIKQSTAKPKPKNKSQAKPNGQPAPKPKKK